MISKMFMCFAVLFAICGMTLGLWMGAHEDFTLAPVHAHVNLLGWVTMFLAGLFYHAYPERQGTLARVHLGLALIGLLIMAPGLAALKLGYVSWGGPMTIIGSVITFAAMILFAFIIFTTPSRARA
jgi:hypothetical protein